MYNRSGSHEALLSGAPLPTLLYFALPIILGNVFQQLYSIVDAVVVGKFLGDLPLSGISVASPIVDVANALIIGGTIGAGVLCAHFCGAEDWDRMRRLNATSLIGGAVLTALISAAGILLSPLLLRAQGTEEAVCQQAAVYLQLVFAGLIFCFLYNYYAAMLRSCGNSRTPFVILLLSSTLHAALDLLFAGVLSWGIRGVAPAAGTAARRPALPPPDRRHGAVLRLGGGAAASCGVHRTAAGAGYADAAGHQHRHGL